MAIDEHQQAGYIQDLIFDANPDPDRSWDDAHASWTGNAWQAVSVENPIVYTFNLRPFENTRASEGGYAENVIEIAEEYQSIPRQALLQWANYAGLKFQETSAEITGEMNGIAIGRADFTLSASINSDGYSSLSPSAQETPDLYTYNESYIEDTFDPEDWAIGSYSYLIFMHEVGHALGLDDLGANPAYTWDSSIMSYRDGEFADKGLFGVSEDASVTPMVYDIAAIQFLYGANFAFNQGSTTYDLAVTANNEQQNQVLVGHVGTIWDGGGEADIITAEHYTEGGVRIDLREGSVTNPYTAIDFVEQQEWNVAHPDIQDRIYSQVGDTVTFLAFGSRIENATGSQGNDTLIGGGSYESGHYSHLPTLSFHGQNVLRGLGGDDIIYGGTGNDILEGGTGFDTYFFRDGDGIDTIIDADRSGVIKWGGAEAGDDAIPTLAGRAEYQAYSGNWVLNSGGQKFVLELSGHDLHIAKSSGSANDKIIISGFVEEGSRVHENTFGNISLGIPDTELSDSGFPEIVWGSIVFGTSSSDILNDQSPRENLHKGWYNYDNVIYYGYSGNDTIWASDNNSLIYAGSGDDSVRGSFGYNIIYGGSGNDSIMGGFRSDFLSGGAGDDLVLGNNGHDYLTGGSGNDTLSAAHGYYATLVGGSDDDIMVGGFGADLFIYNIGDGHDTIGDSGGSGDILQFGSGITFDDLSFSRVDLSVVIDISSGAQSCFLTISINLILTK